MQTLNTVDNLNLGMIIIPFYSIFSISGKIKKNTDETSTPVNWCIGNCSVNFHFTPAVYALQSEIRLNTTDMAKIFH